MTQTESKSEPQVISWLRAIEARLPNATEVDPLTQSQLDDAALNRQLKERHAKAFARILIGQLIAMNFIFFATGLGWLHYERWTLDLFMSGTLAEIFGVVLVITKNLFPTQADKTSHNKSN